MLDLLKVLADENRLRIVKLLSQVEEVCVCNIEEILGLNQSNASKHLNRLRREGIIIKEKRAQWAYFSINREFLEKHPFINDLLKEVEKIEIKGDNCNNE